MRNILTISAISFVSLALASCATPYQSMGFTGGVSATQITSDTAQITARGNAYTDADTIQRYAIRKAAETTLAAGYDTFEIVNSSNRDTHGTSGSAYGGNGYVYGSSWQTLKPGETFMIKMRKGQKPADAPSNWYDAHEVMAYLGTSETKDARKCSEVNGKISCAPSL